MVNSREDARNLRPLAWFTVGGAAWFTYMLVDWDVLGMTVVASLMVLGFWAAGALMAREDPRFSEPSRSLRDYK